MACNDFVSLSATLQVAVAAERARAARRGVVDMARVTFRQNASLMHVVPNRKRVTNTD